MPREVIRGLVFAPETPLCQQGMPVPKTEMVVGEEEPAWSQAGVGKNCQGGWQGTPPRTQDAVSQGDREGTLKE